MKINRLSPEELEQVFSLTFKMQGDADPNLSTLENLERFLRVHTNCDDPEKIARQLNAGIEAFPTLQPQTWGREPEKMMAIYLKKALAENKCSTASMLDFFVEVIPYYTGKKIGVPENATEDELMQIVCHELCSNNLEKMLERSVGMRSCMKEKPLNHISTLTRRLEESRYLAAALYILQSRGELSRLPERVSPYELGAISAACQAADDSLFMASLGEIDWETLIQLLVVILAILLICLLIWFGHTYTVDIYMFIEEFFKSMLPGMEVLPLLLGAIVGTPTILAELLAICFGSIGSAMVIEENIKPIIEKLGIWSFDQAEETVPANA